MCKYTRVLSVIMYFVLCRSSVRGLLTVGVGALDVQLVSSWMLMSRHV